MSSERKTVKILSFVLVAWGFVCLVMGGMGLPSLLTGASASMVVTLVELEVGFLSLALAATGINGANTPSKVGPFVTLALVAVAAGVADVACVVATSATSMQALVASAVFLVLAVLCLVFGRKVREQSRA